MSSLFYIICYIMVIPTMTFFEMYEELAADRSKIEYKRQQLMPKAVKKFRKALRFPAWELFEYTNPSRRNSYILFFMQRVDKL